MLYRNQTHFVPRPSRQDPKWRYSAEPDLLFHQDAWDTAEESRKWVDTQVAQLTADGKRRADEAEKAKKAREDEVVATVFKDRYLAAGGDPIAFDKDLPELRREHARRVALGLDQPINSMAVLKEQLRVIRAGRNLGAAPDPRPQS